MFNITLRKASTQLLFRSTVRFHHSVSGGIKLTQSDLISEINKLRTQGEYGKALCLLDQLKCNYPEAAWKTVPMLRGEILGDQIEASGRQVFTSKLLSTAASKQDTSVMKLFSEKKHDQRARIIFLDIDGVLLKWTEAQINRKVYYENIERVTRVIGLNNIRENLSGDEEQKRFYCTVSLYDVGAALRFSPSAISRLRTLCERTDAKIVISSNWRIQHDGKKAESLQALRWYFKLWGLDHLIIDETPPLDSLHRNDEISAWLEQHGGAGKWDFIVIDDVDHGLSERFGEFFIDTKAEQEFTEKHLEKALLLFDSVQTAYPKPP